MNSRILPVFLSLLAGFFVAVMVQLNASLGAIIGVLESSFAAHVVGAIFAIVILIFIPSNFIKIAKGGAPKYLYFAGILGIFIVISGNIAVPKLGMLTTMSLIIIADLLFCTLADHLGFFNLPRFKITLSRFCGLLFAVAGVMLVLWS